MKWRWGVQTQIHMMNEGLKSWVDQFDDWFKAFIVPLLTWTSWFRNPRVANFFKCLFEVVEFLFVNRHRIKLLHFTWRKCYVDGKWYFLHIKKLWLTQVLLVHVCTSWLLLNCTRLQCVYVYINGVGSLHSLFQF